MRKLILFVWQLPQHILGLLLLLIFRKKLNTVIPYKGDSAVYWTRSDTIFAGRRTKLTD